MITRRHDFDGPTVSNYLIGDSFLSDDGTYYVTTWSFKPYGPFVALNGDGGEIYLTDGDTVRITATQDGGNPYLQGFYGAKCGGQGWIVFKNNAPTGSWASVTANLNDSEIPSPCTDQNQSLTQYRLEQIPIPFNINGLSTPIVLPTIISEHYGGKSMEYASALERSFFAQGVGRVGWEAWTTTPTTPLEKTDVQTRCVHTTYSITPPAGPPGTSWYQHGCSWPINIFTTDGKMTGDSYAWPKVPSDWP